MDKMLPYPFKEHLCKTYNEIVRYRLHLFEREENSSIEILASACRVAAAISVADAHRYVRK